MKMLFTLIVAASMLTAAHAGASYEAMCSLQARLVHGKAKKDGTVKIIEALDQEVCLTGGLSFSIPADGRPSHFSCGTFFYGLNYYVTMELQKISPENAQVILTLGESFNSGSPQKIAIQEFDPRQPLELKIPLAIQQMLSQRESKKITRVESVSVSCEPFWEK